MKQDTVDAVISHNTVIFEDSTNWIFFSSLYQDLPIMSNSLASVCLRCLSLPPPNVYESSNCFSEKAKPLEPEAPSRSHCLSCSVKTDTVEIGFVPGLTLQPCVQANFYKAGDLLAGLLRVCLYSPLQWAAGFREERLSECVRVHLCMCVGRGELFDEHTHRSYISVSLRFSA